MYDVFISYKREERDKAQAVAEALTKHGFKLWWDVDLLPGATFADEIAEIINQSKVAIVLWSAASVKSDFVRGEAELARQRQILIPVRLDDCDVPVQFTGYHTLDLTDWKGGSSDSLLTPLVQAVRSRVEPSQKVPELPETTDTMLRQPAHEADLWKEIASAANQSADEYRHYLERFGEDATFAKLARLRIKALDENETRKHKFTPKQIVAALTTLFTLIGLILGVVLKGQEVLQTLGLSNDTEAVADAEQLSGTARDAPSSALQNSAGAIPELNKPRTTSPTSPPSQQRPKIVRKISIGIQSWRNNPLFVGKYIYVGSSGRNWNVADPKDGLYAFDIDTGTQMWFFKTKRDFNDLTYIEGLIIGGTDSGEVVAVNAKTGRERWRTQLQGRVYAKPAYVEGGVAVATGDGELYLLDLIDGSIKNKKKLDGPVRAGLVSQGTDLWVATEKGTLYDFTVFSSFAGSFTSQIIYPSEFGTPTTSYRNSRWFSELGKGKSEIASIYGAPLILDDKIILGFVRDTYFPYPAVVALDKRNGAIQWFGTDPDQHVGEFGNIRFTPAHYKDLIILGNPYSNKVYALSVKTGEVRWSTELGQRMFQHWPSPVVAGDYVYIGRHDGYLYKLNAADGTREWSLYLGDEENAGLSFLSGEGLGSEARRTQWSPLLGKPIFATAAVSGKHIAVGTGQGYLYLIQDN